MQNFKILLQADFTAQNFICRLKIILNFYCWDLIIAENCTTKIKRKKVFSYLKLFCLISNLKLLLCLVGEGLVCKREAGAAGGAGEAGGAPLQPGDPGIHTHIQLSASTIISKASVNTSPKSLDHP